MRLLYILPVILSALFVTTYVDANVTDRSTGVSFPDQVSFDFDGKEYQLEATGVSTRKKFFTKVYSVAHYVQGGAPMKAGNQFQSIMQDNKAKQLTIKWVYNADANKVRDGYIDAFKAVVRNPSKEVQQDINKFVSFFNNGSKKGDTTILRWIPKGHVEVLINDQLVGEIDNPAFAEALWNIWLGPKSVVNRNQLISMIK